MKKHLIIVTAGLLAISLAGCDATKNDTIYDSDASLAGGDNCSKMYATATTWGNSFKFSRGTLSGAETIWKYQSAGNGTEITLQYTLEETNSGSAKLVLIDPDDTVITLSEASSTRQEDTYSFTADESGTYRVKLAGKESAAVSGTLEYSHGSSSTD
ncbi:MAG: emp24/gp25L/p24 family protein [Oscillospiraceae bacterium]|nr:emp24/gp25L/p24 family protein [Oscillospiraceae bacterium]